MEYLVGLNPAVSVILVIVFYLLSICQSLHVAFVFLRRENKSGWAFISYELLLLIHLILAVLISESAFQNISQPVASLGSFVIALDSLLWINALICAFGLVLCIVFRHLRMILHLVILALCTPPAIWLLGEFWWIVLIFDAALFLFRGTATMSFNIRRQSVTLSRLSIVEALNALPEGLLYVNGAGRVILTNDAMRASLMRIGLPTDLADARGLWDTLKAKTRPGYAFDAVLPEGVRLTISEQEIRLFTMQETVFHKRNARQIFAIDITEEEHLNFDIEQTNYLLEKARAELQTSVDDLQETVENEVLLHMRSRVHDIIGQRLSILHRYLEDGCVSQDSLEDIRELLNTILDDLVMDEVPDLATDLAAIINAFALVGVELAIEGELPEDEETATVFVDVIREATTNAAKHAQASLVLVRMGQGDTANELEISSNGLVFGGPIREGTGLPGMRYASQRLGGSFAFRSGPPFVIRVEIPKKGEAL